MAATYPNTENFWSFVADRETVTLEQIQEDDTYSAGYTIQDAKRRAATLTNSSGSNRLAQARMVWHLWRVKMPYNIIPKVNDLITDQDGVKWRIEQVDAHSLRNRYRLSCAKAPSTQLPVKSE